MWLEMMLSTEQRSLIRRNFLLSPVIINIVVNGLLAWVVYGRTSTIAVSTLVVDALLTCFFIPFLTCIIVVPAIWQLVRQGDLSAVDWSRDDYWWLRWLPDGKWARALAIGLAAAILGTLVITGLLLLFDIGEMAGQEASIGPDRVAAQRHGAGFVDVLLQERKGLRTGLGEGDRRRVDLTE